MTESTRWTRIKDHKVIQWLVAYVAVAFALLQGLDIAAGAFEWPRAILRMSMVALALGLPLTVILAWFHGHRGEQRVSRLETALLSGLLVIGLPLMYLAGRSTDGAPAAAIPTATTFSPPPRSVAVLPFLRLGGNADDEYFSEGLAEELLGMLTRIPELQVAGRTSAFSFKGTDADIPSVGRKLNVATVLEGSVRRSGDRIRVSAQLVSTATGFNLWSESLDRDMTDLLSLQMDIATRVARALKVTLVDDQAVRLAAGGTKDPRALDRFLRARRLLKSPDEAALRNVVTTLDEAIAIDPGFALAYGERAGARTLLADLVATPAEREALVRTALEDAHRSIALAPNAGKTHAALAYVLLYSGGDPDETLRELSSARALDPGDADIETLYAMTAGAFQRSDALAAANRAVTLDPLSPDAHHSRAVVLYYQRQFAEGLVSAQTTLRIQDHLFYRNTASSLLCSLGRYQEALDLTRGDDGDWMTRGLRAMAFGKTGQRAQATAMLQALEKEMGNAAAHAIAVAHAQWGESEQAMKWLDLALRENIIGLNELRADPMLDPLRALPAFVALQARAAKRL